MLSKLTFFAFLVKLLPCIRCNCFLFQRKCWTAMRTFVRLVCSIYRILCQFMLVLIDILTRLQWQRPHLLNSKHSKFTESSTTQCVLVYAFVNVTPEQTLYHTQRTAFFRCGYLPSFRRIWRSVNWKYNRDFQISVKFIRLKEGVKSSTLLTLKVPLSREFLDSDQVLDWTLRIACRGSVYTVLEELIFSCHFY